MRVHTYRRLTNGVLFWRHNHQEEERADTTYKLQPNVYICLHVHHMYLSQLTWLCQLIEEVLCIWSNFLPMNFPPLFTIMITEL